MIMKNKKKKKGARRVAEKGNISMNLEIT